MSMNDPSYVKEQYRDSSNLDARIALHARFSTAPGSFNSWLFDHFDFSANARVLEVGAGTGLLWARNRVRIPSTWQLTLSDFSFGMLQTTRATRLPARLLELDAQTIPFRDESFDAVVANHMLYHVPDLPRALGEIRRILSRGGKLYAATNGIAQMRELYELIDDFRGVASQYRHNQFTLENGNEQLEKYFAHIERFDREDGLVVNEAEPLMAYIVSGSSAQRLTGSGRAAGLRQLIEERIKRDGAIRITKSAGLFVASKE